MEMDMNVIVSRQVKEILLMMEIDDVIDEIKTIYYGSNQLKKEAYKQLLFLATSPTASAWVRNAFQEWNENPMFGGPFNNLDKCLIIKAYRELRNQKKKVKDSSPVTAEEIVDKVTVWIPVEKWNEIHK